jgi:hypothetical protein
VMDGGQDGGAVWEYIIRPLNEAADREAVMMADATAAQMKLWNAWGKTMAFDPWTKRNFPRAKINLSKIGTLMVALNWGNQGNRDRLMSGYQWDESQVQEILDSLDEKDWKLVQGVLDHVNSFWSEIKAKEQRVTGTAPDKVENTPIMTRFGMFAGGYFPVKYDPRQSPRAERFESIEQAMADLRAAGARATTRRQHTKLRTGDAKKPLWLDPQAIFSHMQSVIHDLTHHEMLIDTNRFLRDESVASEMQQRYGNAALKTLRETVRDVATGDRGPQNNVERILTHLRSGAALSTMGFNLTSAALQVTGITQSMERVGPVRFAKAAARIFTSAASHDSAWKQVMEASDFMRMRSQTQQRELREVQSRVGASKETFNRAAYWMMQKMQQTVDVPTWIAAYDKAQDAGHDHDASVKIADQTVIDTQGSGMVKDLASVQRSGPIMKLLTVFYSYFNVTFNLAAERLAVTQWKNPKDVARLGASYIALVAIPAVMGMLLRDLLRGQAPGDDDKLAERAAREQAGFLLGTLVLGRELGSGLSGRFGYSGPAGMRGFDSLNDLLFQAQQGEADAGLGKAALESAGVVFHLPTVQTQRVIDAFTKMHDDGEFDLRAMLFGKTPKGKP